MRLRSLLVLAVAGAAATARADDRCPAAREDAGEGATLADDVCPTAAPDVAVVVERDLDLAYDRLIARPPPHHLRNVLGQLATLVAGTTWYWLDRERQVADWDYPSIGERLSLEAWRFDHNPFGINHIWHPIDGAGFHVIARANHLGLAGAALSGFTTSMAWEFLLEFREKISINDVVVTPGTGVAVGEFFHWLGRYLDSAPVRGTGHAVARWGLAPFHALDGALDDEARAEPARLDALGLSADIWHRFQLGYGLAEATPGGAAVGERMTLHQVTAAGRLAALPGYLAPVRLRRFFRDGNVSQVAVRVGSTGEGLGLLVHADTLLLGLHLQEPTAAGGVRAVTVGASLAFDYRRDRFGPFRDRVGVLHLPGLAVDGHVGGEAWRLSAQLRGRLDFVGLHALAYPAYLEANPDTTEKEILRKQGYYYGFGASSRAELELTTTRLALGGSLGAGRYGSIEGLDRNQEIIDDDVEASDDVVDLEAWLRVAPFGGPVVVELRASEARRDSTVGAFAAEQTLRTIGGSVGATF